MIGHKRYFFLALMAIVLAIAAAVIVGRKSDVLFPPTPTEMVTCNGRMMAEEQIAGYRNITVETMRLLRRLRGLTLPEICVMPQSKLDRAIVRANEPKPDHPEEWLAFRKLQLQDEKDFIPADGLINAAQQIRAMTQSPGRNVAGIDRNSWTWLGPGNIGGRIRSLVVHPTNPNTLWVGSVSGGIWKSTNGGASWQILTDFLGNMAVSTLVMDPTNTNVLYAGTGEGFYNSDGLQGAGVFKTTDGGSTWTQLAATNTADWYYVNRLAFSPNGGTLLAATGSGIWRSTDGGTTWAKTLPDRTLQVAFDPTNVNKAIAAPGYGMAWYSTNGGTSWTNATGLPSLAWLGRVELAYAPSNTTIVYASVGQNSGEIWRSSDGGIHYTRINTGSNFLGGQGWYDNTIWVDPTNSNRLIVGGIDLWRSIDGGVTLSKISQWWSAPLSAHADHHTIVSDPGFNGTTNSRVYFGNDGGIYRTDAVYTVENTSGWVELNNNLGITQFYSAAGNPTSGRIIGGTQDNGTLVYQPGIGDTESWTTAFGGDGGWSAADPTDPNYFYGEYILLQLHRSADAGVSSSYIHSGISDTGTCANFIAPFVLDPNNANTMLAGGCSLWRSANVKATTPAWTAIKPPISCGGNKISAIAVAPGNSNIVWVGHNCGSVYKTVNGAAASPTWTLVSSNAPGLPSRFVTRITIDNINPNIVYVTFGGFNSDNIWMTFDGGTTWSAIAGTGGEALPALPVRSLVIHPQEPDWLYLGTELGVFASANRGLSWNVLQDGPSNVSVDELFWMNTRLVAATHGRGLFSVETFRAASAATNTATAVTGTTATLAGTVTPNGKDTSVVFEYGLTTSYGSSIAATPGTIDGGAGITTVSASLTGLHCDTTYYFRVNATNSVGIGYGSEQSFTTGRCFPAILPTISLILDDDIQSNCQSGALTLNTPTVITGIYSLSSEQGITTSASVQVQTGADVTFAAPSIRLGPGFRVALGAKFRGEARTVTCP